MTRRDGTPRQSDAEWFAQYCIKPFLTGTEIAVSNDAVTVVSKDGQASPEAAVCRSCHQETHSDDMAASGRCQPCEDGLNDEHRYDS